MRGSNVAARAFFFAEQFCKVQMSIILIIVIIPPIYSAVLVYGTSNTAFGASALTSASAAGRVAPTT